MKGASNPRQESLLVNEAGEDLKLCNDANLLPPGGKWYDIYHIFNTSSKILC